MSDLVEDEGASPVSHARALIEKGDELFEAGQHEGALDAYDEVARRYANAADPELRQQVARSLLRKGHRLGKLDREAEAIAVYDELRVRFQEGEAVRVAEIVAQGLLNRALAFGKLDRHAEEIEAYDGLVESYGDSEDPKTREHVAWALYDKAITLWGLDRVDEALATFDDLGARFRRASEPSVRPLVSWGLWKKSKLLDELGRSDERTALYDELIARSDEELDTGLGGIIVWCLWQKQDALGEAGDVQTQLVVLDELIDRFVEATDSYEQRMVVSAFATKASILGSLGRGKDELRTLDEPLSRFSETRDPEVVTALAQNLDRKAAALYRLDRVDDALDAYDEALSILDRIKARDIAPIRVETLLGKAKMLQNADREAEAVVVFDSAIAAYLDGPGAAEPTPREIATAVLVLLQKVLSLAKLGQADALASTRNQLVAMLGDVAESSEAPPPPLSGRSEADLAALLAETHAGDCWLWFATADNDTATRELMAHRALGLYKRTEPWLRDDELDERAGLAALIVRNVADGYAILTRWWSDRNRTTLPLPTRPLVEWAMRLAGIDDWAAEQGHTLDLRESTEDVETMRAEQRTKVLEQLGTEDDTHEGGLVAALVAAAGNYDLFSVLSDSERGREATRDDRIRSFAAWQVSYARGWAGWAQERLEDAAGASVAMLLMTQSFFVTSYGGTASSAEMFPSRNLVREILGNSGAHEWLAHQGAELPDWLAEEDQ